MKFLTWMKYRSAPKPLALTQAQVVVRDLRQLVLSSGGQEMRLLPILREIRKAADTMIEYCEAQQLRAEEARKEAIIRREIIAKLTETKEAKNVS